MARFGGRKKSKGGKRKALHKRVKGRKNARRKPLLPRKGVTQTSYEAGFFDFLKVFWRNNSHMELCNLTKQVANAWEALLPKPKLSKRRVLRDYSREFKALQEEAEQLKRIKEEEMKKEKIKIRAEQETRGGTTDEDTASDTEASSRSNFEKSEESIRSNGSKNGSEEDESQDDKKSYTDESMSEKNTESPDVSGSEENERTTNGNRRKKRKRKERKYKSYDAYLKERGKKLKLNRNHKDKDDENRNEENDRDENKNSVANQDKQDANPKDNIFFPIREETSFERIVRTDYDDRNEMLRKLKLHGTKTDIYASDNSDTKRGESVDSFSSHLNLPKLPLQPKGPNSTSSQLSSPTDTLHVTNLVVGIRQPELQDIFKVFLKDIVLIRVLDNKFSGEAVVEFKNVETAEKVWRQMNGVEYKRLPLVLEFANKEDLLY